VGDAEAARRMGVREKAPAKLIGENELFGQGGLQITMTSLKGGHDVRKKKSSLVGALKTAP